MRPDKQKPSDNEDAEKGIDISNSDGDEVDLSTEDEIAICDDDDNNTTSSNNYSSPSSVNDIMSSLTSDNYDEEGKGIEVSCTNIQTSSSRIITRTRPYDATITSNENEVVLSIENSEDKPTICDNNEMSYDDSSFPSIVDMSELDSDNVEIGIDSDQNELTLAEESWDDEPTICSNIISNDDWSSPPMDNMSKVTSDEDHDVEKGIDVAYEVQTSPNISSSIMITATRPCDTATEDDENESNLPAEESSTEESSEECRIETNTTKDNSSPSTDILEPSDSKQSSSSLKLLEGTSTRIGGEQPCDIQEYFNKDDSIGEDYEIVLDKTFTSTSFDESIKSTEDNWSENSPTDYNKKPLLPVVYWQRSTFIYMLLLVAISASLLIATILLLLSRGQRYQPTMPPSYRPFPPSLPKPTISPTRSPTSQPTLAPIGTFAPSSSPKYLELPFAVNSDIDGGGVGLDVNGWTQPTPVEIEIISRSSEVSWIRVAYSTIEETVSEADTTSSSNATNVIKKGVATVVTPSGSILEVIDEYIGASRVEIVLNRRVEVLEAAEDDVGFSSRFTLNVDEVEGLRSREFFVPGVWYRQSQQYTPERAIARDLNAAHVLIREDRLPLPMVSVREPKTGDVATLVRQKTQPEDGATFANENFRRRLIDGRLQFGSLGVIVQPDTARLGVAYQFPGSEGDRTYICCGESSSGWTNRSHPLESSVRHTYQLRFTTSKATESYSDAVEVAWRRAWSESSPVVPEANLDKVYNYSVELLGKVTRNYNGVPSVPFKVTIPNGIVEDESSQMGFVGKAIPVAYHLIRAGLERENVEWIAKGEGVIDFWVGNSMTSSGVPRTWYDPPYYKDKNNTVFKWRPDTHYMGHVRIACDGMLGIIAAWKIRGEHRWLQYAKEYGDFLISKQELDGSIAGEWKRQDGSAWSNFKNVGYQVIPFLIELSESTGDDKYGKAAVKVGEYSWKQLKDTYLYIGGTPDNPNVIDKEAGVLALKAFLALHRYDDNLQWIEAARQAATYSETWTYSWDIPIPEGDPKNVYPPIRSTYGSSLISTGHSGSDNYMAHASYDYYELYRLTNDEHYLDFALFLERSTKQVVDWDGKLGYSVQGLMSEAVKFTNNRGRGVNKWLPWLTVAILDSLVATKEATGSYYLPRTNVS